MKKNFFIFNALLFALFTTPILTLAANNSSLGSGITVSEATELLTGIVKDADGKALPGATIKKAGNTNGFTSDKNGEFRALGIKRGENLEISAKGYKTKRIKAAPNMEIRLEKDEPAPATQEEKNEVAAPATTTPVTTAPAPTTTNITITGTVADKATGETLIGANVYPINDKNKGTQTDIDGKFTLYDIPADSKITISYMGYVSQTIDQVQNGQNINIQLAENENAMQEVTSTGCSNDTRDKLNATSAEYDLNKKTCVAVNCIGEPGEYQKQPDGSCKKVNCSAAEKQQVINEKGTNPKWNGKQCVPGGCADGYHPNNDNTQCLSNKCTNPEDDWNDTEGKCVQVRCSQQQLNDANAKSGTWDATNKKCIPECDTKKYHLNETTNKCEDNKCQTAEEDWDGKQCIKVRCTDAEKQAINAKNAKWDTENNTCVAIDCEDATNYKLENGECVANDCPAKELEKLNATSGTMQDGKCIPNGCKTDYELIEGVCTDQNILKEKQKAYDDAHAKEQSIANRTLTALTTAATGIGGMELARGLAEQSADKDAAADMAAYVATMHCDYADGKQVKYGPEEIELPGGNNQEMMNLRAQYLALAADLKERKTALGMKPGIESEEIGDKTQTGLYDDENVGITSGNYASLYRAQVLGSESDQAQIDDAAAASKRRVIGGAVAAGAGVVGGFVGNELINGELGKKLKEKNQGKALRAATEIEKDALDNMKKCLKNTGVKDTDSLEFQNFYISVLSVKNINCKQEITQIAGVQPSTIAAKTIFADSNDANAVYDQLIKSFGPTIAGKMIGVKLSQPATNSQKQNAINTLKSEIDKVTKRFQDAAKEDEKRLSASGLKDFDIDFSSILSSFSGDGASSSIMNVVNNGFK